MADIHDLNLPDDLHDLSIKECEDLCKQIREIILKTVSENGGHLASNLGSVEITVAMHRVFHSPDDKFIWDVGHQDYTHKILTGRLDQFGTLRQKGGISGFPKPEESEHDIFISGHSSTSISVACGVAEAMRIKGDRDHSVVAVIGDGALTGGLAYEGLNNAGNSKDNIIVILNDNEKSISKNVGALSKYLRNIRTKESYVLKKQRIERKIRRIPIIGNGLAVVLKKIKDILTMGFMNKKELTLFENMGFVYLGPVDGHNLKDIDEALRAARSYRRPVLVHVNTVKGKGYSFAEENPGEYHGVSKFDPLYGVNTLKRPETFSDVFGKELVKLANGDKRICAITAAMKYGTGLNYFAKDFPDRFFDVGIAEEHAVTFAGGLASQGMLPVFAVYSSFLQRSYDQMLHDVSIGKLHVVLAIDRAGIVGQDGETHQGMFDTGLVENIPNTCIYSPSNYAELRYSLYKVLYDETGLACLRYPRGGEGDNKQDEGKKVADYYITSSINIEKNCNSKDILVMTYGRISANVEKACKKLKDNGIKTDFLKLVKIYPLCDDVKNIILNYKKVFIFEETYKNSGISGIIGRIMAESQNHGMLYNVSSNEFIKQSPVDEAIDEIGLSEEKIYNYISEALKNKNAEA